jgi:hypothetical protein
MENPSPAQLITSALQPRDAPDFTFITITNPNDIKDAKQQTAIRRQARTNAGRTKPKKPKPVRLTFDLPVHSSSSSEPEEQIPQAASQRPEEEAVEDTIVTRQDPTFSQEIRLAALKAAKLISISTLRPMSVTFLGTNPLAIFPLKTNERMRQLVSFLYDSMDITPKPLGPIWFTIGMIDKSAFQLTLGNAAYCFNKETGLYQGELFDRGETAESMSFYTMAMESVKRRLRDPIDGVSEGVIGSVLGFACHDVCFLLALPLLSPVLAKWLLIDLASNREHEEIQDPHGWPRKDHSNQRRLRNFKTIPHPPPNALLVLRSPTPSSHYLIRNTGSIQTTASVSTSPPVGPFHEI